MTRLGLMLALGALGAGVYLSAASAIGHPDPVVLGPPPPVRLAVAHSRPVAGQRFTGITITNLRAHISWVRCAATVAHKDVPGLPERFYAETNAYDPGPYLNVVTCSWRIPRHSVGKWLRATAYVGVDNGLEVEGGTVASWRVRGSSASPPKGRGSTAVGKGVSAGVPRLGEVIRQRLPPSIVYSYSDAQYFGIFAIKPDGSDPHALTPNAVNAMEPGWNAMEPSWSPDGTRILYTTGCIIWVMSADGSNPHPLIPVGATPPGFPCADSLDQPIWSPNGKRIIYRYSDAKTDMIRIAKADGSHVHRVPHTEGAVSASFSPDGHYIVFSRDTVFDRRKHQAVFKPHLYVVRPNGTGLRQIARGYGGEDPSWSPDGKHILYSCSIYTNPVIPPPPGTPAPIGVAPTPVPHGICEITRTHPKPRVLYSVPSGGYIGGQTWSADGKTILVTDGANQIALLSPSGGTPVEITHAGYSWDPSR